MIRQELDVWGDRPVASIRRADVRELLEQIVDRGAPVLANRVLALVRKMLNFAIDQDWIDANPAAKMARPGAEKARSRVLSERRHTSRRLISRSAGARVGRRYRAAPLDIAASGAPLASRDGAAGRGSGRHALARH